MRAYLAITRVTAAGLLRLSPSPLCLNYVASWSATPAPHSWAVATASHPQSKRLKYHRCQETPPDCLMRTCVTCSGFIFVDWFRVIDPPWLPSEPDCVTAWSSVPLLGIKAWFCFWLLFLHPTPNPDTLNGSKWFTSVDSSKAREK